MITLYELAGKNDLRFSPPCWNVKLCLLYKNIDFETVAVGFSEKNKILFSNQQLVPVLKHQNGHISDSWNIINWLDENYENPKLFVNETSKNFSHFLYLWTSRQILPILFKIIAHEIPNILEGDDLDHYIVTREERIKGPITKFVPVISDSIKKFRKAHQVKGQALDSTHYMAEEIPQEITMHMLEFFSQNPIHKKEISQ